MRFSFEGSSSNVLHFKLLEVFYHLQTRLSGVGEKKKKSSPPSSVSPSIFCLHQSVQSFKGYIKPCINISFCLINLNHSSQWLSSAL